MKNSSIFFYLLLSLIFFQCTKETAPPPNSGGNNPPPPSNNSPEWLIPQGSVFDGGPGKDGIPAISNPVFISPDEATYLSDDDLVLGIKVGDDIRAYPHPILDWHEIINDEIDGKQVAITYCPLTGTGVGWDRSPDGNLTTFGVSGLLYNTNLIPYDRATDSNWSQMLLKCVNGPLAGIRIKTHQLVETTWGVWRSMYPQTQVVSTNTGYNRNYQRYPYGDYRTNHSSLIFPVAIEDNRLPWKERVLGVINEDGVAEAFRIESMPQTGIGIRNGDIVNTKIVVAGSKASNFMVAFKRELADGSLPEFSAVNGKLPVIMVDQEGNEWDIFGEAVSGPRTGESLQPVDAFIGYWVAWGAFYPDLMFR